MGTKVLAAFPHQSPWEGSPTAGAISPERERAGAVGVGRAGARVCKKPGRRGWLQSYSHQGGNEECSTFRVTPGGLVIYSP